MHDDIAAQLFHVGYTHPSQATDLGALFPTFGRFSFFSVMDVQQHRLIAHVDPCPTQQSTGAQSSAATAEIAVYPEIEVPKQIADTEKRTSIGLNKQDDDSPAIKRCRKDF